MIFFFQSSPTYAGSKNVAGKIGLYTEMVSSVVRDEDLSRGIKSGQQRLSCRMF